jgi:hypothetical protein
MKEKLSNYLKLNKVSAAFSELLKNLLKHCLNFTFLKFFEKNPKKTPKKYLMTKCFEKLSNTFFFTSRVFHAEPILFLSVLNTKKKTNFNMVLSPWQSFRRQCYESSAISVM